MKRHTVMALALTGIGLVGLILAFTTFGSVRDHIRETYPRTGTERVPGDDDPTEVFSSEQTVSQTAEDIADSYEPAERRITSAGVFLRYEDDIVSIVPRPEGTRILLDDEDTGYRRGYAYLGGWWGTYSGRGEGFRGGGPGGGK